MQLYVSTDRQTLFSPSLSPHHHQIVSRYRRPVTLTMEVVGLIASSVTLLEVSLKTVGFFQEMATVQDDFRCLQEVV
jgi:hypothetical protein